MPLCKKGKSKKSKWLISGWLHLIYTHIRLRTTNLKLFNVHFFNELFISVTGILSVNSNVLHESYRVVWLWEKQAGNTSLTHWQLDAAAAYRATLFISNNTWWREQLNSPPRSPGSHLLCPLCWCRGHEVGSTKLLGETTAALKAVKPKQALEIRGW